MDYPYRSRRYRKRFVAALRSEFPSESYPGVTAGLFDCDQAKMPTDHPNVVEIRAALPALVRCVMTIIRMKLLMLPAVEYFPNLPFPSYNSVISQQPIRFLFEYTIRG